MLVPIRIPPGVFANGTAYEAKGRWNAASLVRWIDGAMQPVGGWRPRSAAGPMTGAARAMLAWKDNAGGRWCAVGTHSRLYVRTASDAVHDVTPAGFAAGRADALAVGGYGYASYGTGAYGAARPDLGAVQPATVWSLDTWGERLVGCAPGDGKLYEWRLNTGQPAQPITGAGAPHAADALVVSAERFLFALSGRTVKWCDQGDNTVWTAAPDNQAGEVELQTHGALTCGRRVRGGTLLFTDVDVHLASFVGGVFVHRFERVGNDCGLVAPGAAVSLDASAVWMGRENFWIWDGTVRALPSEVSDKVFSDFNAAQASKVTAFHNSAFGEVWWFYPSGGSNEVDRAVSWTYRDGVWATHELARTCAVDAGVFRHPMAVDPQGVLYEHETGFAYEGSAGPWAQSGPFEIGGGERMALVRQLVPDERTGGDVRVSFLTRDWPNGPAATHGPYDLAARTDVLFTARQASVRVEPARPADWRWGEPRVDVAMGARR